MCIKMSIAWLTYFVFCFVVSVLVLIIIYKDEKLENYKYSSEYWYDKFSKVNSDLSEYKQIVENIKNSLPF